MSTVGEGRTWRADDTFIHRPVRADQPEGSVVIGLLVPVPEPWAQLLVEWRGKCGDPQAGLVPPHVTLLPPTEIALRDRTAISAHLSDVARRHAPFDLRLRGTDSFRPVSEVVYAAVDAGAGECARVADAIRSGPLDRPLSFPYHPHVTVAHDVPGEMLDLAAGGLADLEAVFRVGSFTEFEQRADGGWSVVREYRLGG